MSHSPSPQRGLLGLFLLVLILPGCSTAKNPWAAALPGQKRILVSFAPLYSMTQAVAGKHAYVLCLLSKDGPHNFQPPNEDMLKLHRADLILINGLGLDDNFMDRLKKGANTSAAMVRLGDALPKELKHWTGPQQHGDHVHEGDYDPHVWLGPPQAMAMTQEIARQLGKLDPQNKDEYVKNADDYVRRLEKLQTEGKALLAGKKNRNILPMHESLFYFAKAFDLNVTESLQLHPGVDPDPARLTKLAKLCKEKDIHVIAVEPQFGTRQAEILRNFLADKLPMQLVEVDPLETAPLARDSANPDPDFYLHKMRENIEKLAEALP
jgi:zinc transport system substrate-binding protein